MREQMLNSEVAMDQRLGRTGSTPVLNGVQGVEGSNPAVLIEKPDERMDARRASCLFGDAGTRGGTGLRDPGARKSVGLPRSKSDNQARELPPAVITNKVKCHQDLRGAMSLGSVVVKH